MHETAVITPCRLVDYCYLVLTSFCRRLLLYNVERERKIYDPYQSFHDTAQMFSFSVSFASVVYISSSSDARTNSFTPWHYCRPCGATGLFSGAESCCIDQPATLLLFSVLDPAFPALK